MAAACALTERLVAALARIVAETSDERALAPIASACLRLEAADASLLANLKAIALRAVQVIEAGAPETELLDQLRLAAEASGERILQWVEEVAAPPS